MVTKGHQKRLVQKYDQKQQHVTKDCSNTMDITESDIMDKEILSKLSSTKQATRQTE